MSEGLTAEEKKATRDSLIKETKSSILDDEIDAKKKHIKALEKEFQDKIEKFDKLKADTDEIKASAQQWDHNVHCSETKEFILIKIFKGQESRFENKEVYIRFDKAKVVGDYRINLLVYQPDAVKLAKIAEIAKENAAKLNSGG